MLKNQKVHNLSTCKHIESFVKSVCQTMLKSLFNKKNLSISLGKAGIIKTYSGLQFQKSKTATKEGSQGTSLSKPFLKGTSMLLSKPKRFKMSFTQTGMRLT